MLEEIKCKFVLKCEWLQERHHVGVFLIKSLPSLQESLVALAQQLHLGEGIENASG